METNAMRAPDVARLVVLGALWGASFLLLRVVVPSLGALATAESRVAIAGFVLLAWHWLSREPFAVGANARPMFVVGVFNSALPFALFAFAARTLPAGYIAILNATTPLFGAVIARAWLREPLGGRRLAGVLCGIVGVAALVGLGPVRIDHAAALACAASLAAAACYGFAGNYTKQLARPVPPTAMATGSQLAAAFVLAPLVAIAPPGATPTAPVLGAVLFLAVASTAIAYLLYFRLIRDVGATRALTVTFIVPLFAVVWAWIALGETPTPRMGVGGAIVVVATWLVVGGRAPLRVVPSSAGTARR